MTSPYDTYSSPLASRNASPEMLRLWSPRHKFNTWRRIWLAVAEAQHELTSSPTVREGQGGAAPMSAPLVTREQVEELRAVVNRPGGITDEEMKAAERYERELRHDVMAHVHALGDSCPKAKGIIHLGMTSQDVVCNADMLIIRAAVSLTRERLAAAIRALGEQANLYAGLPTLGYTHYQPAQPLTVGRRAAQWAHDLDLCRERISRECEGGYMFPLLYRGLRGATGTQASFLALCGGRSLDVDRLSSLFHQQLDLIGRADWREALVGQPNLSDSDREEVRKFNARAEAELGARLYTHNAGEFELSGQTYPRVVDTFILADLASTASVLHKIATDIRLLSNRKELDEPFEDKQIGSSAMPYKRNPMRCERICGLSRFVMNLVGNAYDTAATQWLERTLDDSSNRRLSLPEAFLALDGALDLMHNVASGLIVHEAMVRKNLMAELPFMATENILMACVKLGGDRQHYHELLRVHAQAAGMRVKQEGLDNDLLDRLKADMNFWSKARGGPLSAELDWDGVMDPMKYVGRSVEQTERFIKEVVEPLRAQYGEAIAKLGTSGPRV
jgi:adenylosuccinate lyase